MEAKEILEKVAEKILIYDGMDDEFYNTHTLNLKNGYKIEFSTSDINKLKFLENKNYLNQIINSCNGIYFDNLIPEIPVYKNENGLNIYFKETDIYIAIIALGEFQPGRYKIYQEGIFKKNKSNL